LLLPQESNNFAGKGWLAVARFADRKSNQLSQTAHDVWSLLNGERLAYSSPSPF